MLVGSSKGISSAGYVSAVIGGSSILFRSSVKYLGVHLDKTLSTKQHINSLCCNAFLAVRKIVSIFLFLPEVPTAKLV